MRTGRSGARCSVPATTGRSHAPTAGGGPTSSWAAAAGRGRCGSRRATPTSTTSRPRRPPRWLPSTPGSMRRAWLRARPSHHPAVGHGGRPGRARRGGVPIPGRRAGGHVPGRPRPGRVMDGGAQGPLGRGRARRGACPDGRVRGRGRGPDHAPGLHPRDLEHVALMGELDPALSRLAGSSASADASDALQRPVAEPGPAGDARRIDRPEGSRVGRVLGVVTRQPQPSIRVDRIDTLDEQPVVLRAGRARGPGRRWRVIVRA